MIARQILHGSTQAVSSPSRYADDKLIRRIAEGDADAVGAFVDRWISSFYTFTDGLRMSATAGDTVVEEVFRRVMFDAPRFVARPERFHDWLRVTVRDCAAAVIAKQMLAGRSTRSGTWGVGTTDEAAQPSAVKSCSALLRAARLPEALRYLNSLTPYRFTGIYRFEGTLVENVHLFDRESGLGDGGSVSPISETYCLWIQETLSIVQMRDSLSDPRALGHAKREVVRSYCGGPIRDEVGDLLGTICHFDYESRETPAEVLTLLKAVSPLLAGAVCAAAAAS